jgi:replicative DNA helicase
VSDRQDVDRRLYELWTDGGTVPFDTGGIDFLGAWVARDVADPADWQKTLAGELCRVQSMAQRFENLNLADARRVAKTMLLRAELVAADHRERGRKPPGAKVQTSELIRKPLVEPLEKVVQRITAEAENPPDTLPTSFASVNFMLNGGFRRADLCYIGGRPSVGKSAFAAELTRHCGATGHPVLFVSREMAVEAIGRRLMAQEGGLAASTLRSGQGINWQKYTETAARIYHYPIYLSSTITSVSQAYDAAVELGNLHLIVIDYLQLLSAPKTIRDRRQQVEAISKECKELALRLNIPVVVLSSLSRPPGALKNWRPSLASLRESGELEHDADIVILMHRDEGSFLLEANVAKNREGEVGIVQLHYEVTTQTFREWDPEKDDASTGLF